MRFDPRPCAEFPNDNPELHNGALWVLGFCRAKPRAIISAESVARAVARESAVAELGARTEAEALVTTLPQPVEHRPLSKPEAPPMVAEAPPIVAEVIPAVAEAPPMVAEVIPAVAEAPPMVAEAPPAVVEFLTEAPRAVCEPEVSEAVVESVFAQLDDVFAAEDFSATPPPADVIVAEPARLECAVASSALPDFGTLELEPEHVASVVAELDELFEEPPEEWQTPVSAVALRLPEVEVAALEVAPFRVPRPELFGNVADEPAPLLGALAPELPPLSLDLTPPPPGVAGWAQLSALLVTFLLERGATRAAALLPQLLEGRRVQLERLSEETRQCLREANIAESTTDGCWPSAEFQRQAAALYIDHKNGQAKDVLRWVSDVVRALLANSMSHAAIGAHLEEAGVKVLLSRAA